MTLWKGSGEGQGRSLVFGLPGGVYRASGPVTSARCRGRFHRNRARPPDGAQERSAASVEVVQGALSPTSWVFALGLLVTLACGGVPSDSERNPPDSTQGVVTSGPEQEPNPAHCPGVCAPAASCIDGVCVCGPDYEGDGLICNPVLDACGENPCASNALCSNEGESSWTCACPQGFQSPDPNSVACVLPDPCTPPPCGLNEVCMPTGTVGDHACNCAPGHTRHDGACVPIEQPAVLANLQPGFINVAWWLPAVVGGYDEIELDIRPEISGLTSEPLQYFAFGGHRFSSGPSGNGFYGGLQTRMGNRTAHSGKRGVIFSVWGALNAIPHGAALADIDTVNCDGETGAVCVQLSLPLAWKNEQTYRMRYQMKGPALGYPGSQLVRASVVEVSTGTEHVLGDAVIPNAWGRLPNRLFSFTEVFPPGPEGSLCSNYVPTDANYLRLRGNLSAQPAGYAQYASAYNGPCIELFHYASLSTGYRMRLGIFAP